MTQETFKQIKYNGAPYPDVYINGVETEVVSINGSYFELKDGSDIHYIEAKIDYNETRVSFAIVKAIQKELIDCYHYGGESLSEVCNRLALRYKVKAGRVNSINASLTIKDIVEIKKQLK